MAAQRVERLPDGPDWAYEVKFDGYRALLLKEGDHVELRSRNDKDLTRTYPTVTAAGLTLRADAALLDGELVAVDASGRPSFQALQHRSAHPLHTPLYYAFDLLHLDGRDLLARPFEERRKALAEVVGNSRVLLSETLEGTAEQVIAAVAASHSSASEKKAGRRGRRRRCL